MSTREVNESDEFWSDGSFAEPLDSKGMKERMKTFHMKHAEAVRFNCKVCGAKISAHNKDWHDEMCDDCFHKEYFPDTEGDT